MLINCDGFWMHLHTYHINTDKVARAKRARQTAAVNSQRDLRRRWVVTEPRRKRIIHGMHVLKHAEPKQENMDAHWVLTSAAAARIQKILICVFQ